MAQMRLAWTARRLARRWGFGGRSAGTAALVGLALAAAAVGLAVRGGTADMLVVRAAPSDQAADETGETATSQGVGSALEGEEPKPQTYVVHVDGAVAAPGVVHIEGLDVRVFDAVEKAGGLLDDADTTEVNLAETLVDGAKIHIPREGEQDEPASAATQAGQVSTAGATGAGEGVALVNINLASVEELQTLTGIGEVTARTIVDDRERNGPFASPEDLMRVSGIGEKKFEKVRGQICV